MAHSSHSERSIHEMLKDTPPMNESNSAIHSGTEGRIKHPSNLVFRNNSGLFYILFFIQIDVLCRFVNANDCHNCFSSGYATRIPI